MFRGYIKDTKTDLIYWFENSSELYLVEQMEQFIENYETPNTLSVIYQL